MTPFGLTVELETGTRWENLDPAQIQAWLDEHKVLVLRGLQGLEKRNMPLAARTLGPIQAWSFGAVNVLKVDPDKQNYLFTEACVPLHWDGAFKGEIPNLLMFHCLEAPPPEAGGATVFVDSTAVWDGLSSDERALWKQGRYRYETEKVVHYGGQFEANLVDTHPRTGATTLRFAEPVVGLNPVTVTRVSAGGPSVTEVSQVLGREEGRLLHRWRVGDVVLADNQALLHGREAFEERAPRHIHRVNILDSTRGPWQWLIDSIRLRRPEFMVAEIPINLLALLWVAPDAQWLTTLAYWEATAVFFLLFHFGDMVNCLADRELDAVYKTSLSEAVFGLGVRNVTAQLVATTVLALTMTVHLAWMLDRWWLVPWVVVGLVLGHQYSVGPGKLKARGLLQIPTPSGINLLGPMEQMVGEVSGAPTLQTLLFIGLYGALAQAIILVNTAEDYDEDVAAGLKTSAVALGRVGAAWTSAAGVFAAGAGLLALMVTTALAESPHGAVWYALGLWTSAWAWATLEIGHLAWRVGRARDPDTELKRGAMKMPVWITVVAWLTLLVVGVRALMS